MNTPTPSFARLALLLALIAATPACFEYSQVPVTDLQAGMDVRAQISGMGAERLLRGGEAQARVLDGFTVNGIVLGMRSDSVLISVPTIYYEGDYRARTLTQEVLLSRTELVGAQVRRLNRTRTTVVTAGVGVALIAAILATRQGAGANGGIPVHGGPAEHRIPVGIQWRLP
jgi:hypothetical protein